MIYKFTLDDVAYEADVTVTPGSPGSGPSMENAGGDPPEPAEIDIEAIWLVINGKRNAELPDDSEAYAAAADYLLNCGNEILEKADDEAQDAKADAAEARADARKEDF